MKLLLGFYSRISMLLFNKMRRFFQDWTRITIFIKICTNKGLIVNEGDILNLHFNDNYFDLTLCFDCIEYCADPYFVFDKT